MALLRPKQLLFVGVQAGRVVLLRGVGDTGNGRFPISVDAYVPDPKLFDSLARLQTPCELTVVFDNEGTVTPMHLIEAEVITAKAESAA